MSGYVLPEDGVPVICLTHKHHSFQAVLHNGIEFYCPDEDKRYFPSQILMWRYV